jgi:2-polyprenyl-3-methyl-5-hydroxy-6-metoxy-1,4-benzoquinol methylase
MTVETWPAEDLEFVPNCPICGGAQRSLLYGDLTDSVFGVAPGQWALYRCLNCESAWLDPRPTQATVGKAYEHYYTHVPEDDAASQSKSALVRQLHSWLSDYKNACYCLERRPVGFFGRWLVSLVPSLRAKANTQCRHLPRPPIDGGRLLDVGFGHGGFLKVASEMGWNAEGIDFDPKAVEVARARGLNVRCASVGDLSERKEQYDVITVSHVIEHVYDPLGLLEDLYRLLKPGGSLWLDTPNLSSLGAQRFGRNWRALEPPRHLTLFTFKSLRKSLEKAGFKNIHWHWHGMAVFFIYAESDAIAHGCYTEDGRRHLLPSVAAILAELWEMVSPSRREFLTVTAYK